MQSYKAPVQLFSGRARCLKQLMIFSSLWFDYPRLPFNVRKSYEAAVQLFSGRAHFLKQQMILLMLTMHEVRHPFKAPIQLATGLNSLKQQMMFLKAPFRFVETMQSRKAPSIHNSRIKKPSNQSKSTQQKTTLAI
eukprot:6460198-Amphidinium_carterae.2